ncbi:hypothetical protein PSEUBRA_000941 [Kalmanozyma brasiliensis GHG001]|uniref:uncharacterized protein n=1 Tax=Kalmanozyma brasiliensis (strain GHG001) TaxID=1365824 RepID=UPI001CE82FBD|nr:uncharacterized protein PSEUBRA_000941 [Kalmanozyma brasiliensis GHG001]KAF6766866.1 hypothetical protein PSEUBRA_000941 [Kalmanozyma brasiliensis GHG001]
MSTTIPNSTISASLASASISPGNMTTSNVSANAGPQMNSTLTGAPAPPSNGIQDSMVTLLTFGPLSSCIELPDLSGITSPLKPNLSEAVRAQVLHDWLVSLPTKPSCTSFSWTFRPDYFLHLDAMTTFQAELEQLFPSVSNSTAASTSTQTNSTFFSNIADTSAPAATPTGTPLPETLPLWIGITIACTTLVHLLALILHVCSELDSLFPSFAEKLEAKPEEETLPSHAVNESLTTLVEAKPDVSTDEKPSDPPQYTAPTSDTVKPAPEKSNPMHGGLQETPSLIRISRQAKRLVVPLLLVSALMLIGVAVVLNAKFAVGPVAGFSSSDGSTGVLTSSPGATSSVSAAVPVSSVSTASTVTTSDVINSTRANSDGARDSRPAASNDVAAPTPAADAVTKSPAPPIDMPSPTASMVRIVKRQTNFFPAPSSSDSPVPPAPTPVSSPAAPSEAAPSSSLPNASLFPTTLPSTSPSPTPTALSSTTSPRQSTESSGTPTPAPAPAARFVLQRGDSTHRLWWIVMLDLLLWFVQRRRTRTQTAMDKARKVVLKQLGGRHVG